MNEKQIEQMVDRFLQWPLPADFAPDGGISFDGKSHPVGTNLLTAIQAKEMFRHVLEATKGQEVCEWWKPEDNDYYSIGCVPYEKYPNASGFDELPSLGEGCPQLCPFCGKPIKEVQP